MRYLYVIQSGDYFKVGITNDLEKRLNQIKTSSPFESRIAYSILVDNAERLEKDTHAKLEEYRTRGEWFEIDLETILKAISEVSKLEFQSLDDCLVLPVEKIVRDQKTLRTIECPFCGHKHEHGWMPRTPVISKKKQQSIPHFGHRVAHCSIEQPRFITLANGETMNSDDGYYLGADRVWKQAHQYAQRIEPDW